MPMSQISGPVAVTTVPPRMTESNFSIGNPITAKFDRTSGRTFAS
jgi:hypothetical protein